MGSPWEPQAGRSGRPARGGTLTAARQPGRDQQLGERAQQGRQRHLAGLGSASSSPAALGGRRPVERSLAGAGAEPRALRPRRVRVLTPRIGVTAWYSSSSGLSPQSAQWDYEGGDYKGENER